MIFDRLERATRAMAVLLACASGCLDFSPIVVASAPDSGTTGDLCAACYRAANQPGPGCANEVAACNAIDRCKQAFECSEVKGCYRGSKENLVSCGTPCAAEAGVVTVDDPAIVAGTRFYACILGPCRQACFPETTRDQ